MRTVHAPQPRPLSERSRARRPQGLSSDATLLLGAVPWSQDQCTGFPECRTEWGKSIVYRLSGRFTVISDQYISLIYPRARRDQIRGHTVKV
jgi:hypothetical protein